MRWTVLPNGLGRTASPCVSWLPQARAMPNLARRPRAARRRSPPPESRRPRRIHGAVDRALSHVRHRICNPTHGDRRHCGLGSDRLEGHVSIRDGKAYPGKEIADAIDLQLSTRLSQRFLEITHE